MSAILMPPIPIFPLLFIAFSLLVIFHSRKPISHWVGKLHYPSLADAKPIVWITLQLLLVGIGIEFLATSFNVNDTHQVAETINVFASDPVWAVPFLGISALGEELFFRGILFPMGGMFFSSILFAFFHAGYGSFVQLIGAFVAGLVLCRARTHYKSIFPLIVAHFLYNIIIVFGSG